MSVPQMSLPATSYDPVFFSHLQAAEDRHFWFCARRRIIKWLARDLTRNEAQAFRVLEVGCGTGGVLRALERACPEGRVYGMDLFPEGFTYAQRRTSCPLLVGDVCRPPFGPVFQLIGLFDVLEHLSDDLGVLANLHSMLAPGGHLLLTVPAHPWLWSRFDEAAHHCRRYREAELHDKLKQSGFQVEYLTPFLALLVPLVWLARKWHVWQGAEKSTMEQVVARELRIVPVVNNALKWLLSRELGLIKQRRRVPWGTSLLAVARKSA